MEPIIINDRISYYESLEDPLSSDVIIVRGDSTIWLYDVGNSPLVTAGLNSLPGPKQVILSHFHPDHSGALSETDYDVLLVGNNTRKYTKEGTIVSDTITVKDGVHISVHPFPSSHAKGSLALGCDEYLFAGDGLYTAAKEGRYFYNVSILTAQIAFFKEHRFKYIGLSHRKPFIVSYDEVFDFLQKILSLKEPGSPYICIN